MANSKKVKIKSATWKSQNPIKTVLHMDDLDKFLEEAGKLLEVIEIEKVRKDKFIDPLVLDLEHVAMQYFPEISNYSADLRDLIRGKAIRRTNDICEFMFKRIYDGVDDSNEDITKFKVAPRHDEEWKKRFLEKRLEKIPPEYHAGVIEALSPAFEMKAEEIELTYDCFEKTKKALWVSFPEISEFSGNSILHMNYYAYDRIWYFVDDLYQIV